MAKYKSHYKELAFYADGERKQFVNGEYETADKKEIAVLDELADAQKQAEDKAEQKPAKKQAPAKPKASDK